jgi:hypothetical protein
VSCTIAARPSFSPSTQRARTDIMGTFVFKWEHPAEEVFVTGTFDNWTKSVRLEKVGDVFQKEVELEPQTDKIYYKVGAIFVAVVVFVVVVFLLLFLPPVFVVVVATVGQVDNGGGGGGSRPLSSHLGRLAPLTLAAHRAALPPS